MNIQIEEKNKFCWVCSDMVDFMIIIKFYELIFWINGSMIQNFKFNEMKSMQLYNH